MQFTSKPYGLKDDVVVINGLAGKCFQNDN